MSHCRSRALGVFIIIFFFLLLSWDHWICSTWQLWKSIYPRPRFQPVPIQERVSSTKKKKKKKHHCSYWVLSSVLNRWFFFFFFLETIGFVQPGSFGSQLIIGHRFNQFQFKSEFHDFHQYYWAQSWIFHFLFIYFLMKLSLELEPVESVA